MVNINVWGPITWKFFHTLSVKLKEDSYPIIGKQLFHYIKRICSLLLCPECALHSTRFFSRIADSSINNKLSIINTLYILHNNVNTRKNKQLFKYENIIPSYENNNIIQCYNEFASVYRTQGDLIHLSDSFHRQRLLMEVRRFILMNIQHFNK